MSRVGETHGFAFDSIAPGWVRVIYACDVDHSTPLRGWVHLRRDTVTFTFDEEELDGRAVQLEDPEEPGCHATPGGAPVDFRLPKYDLPGCEIGEYDWDYAARLLRIENGWGLLRVTVPDTMATGQPGSTAVTRRADLWVRMRSDEGAIQLRPAWLVQIPGHDCSKLD